MEQVEPVSAASPLEHLRIVLVETSHPGNIGAAARAMKTMGLARLVLVRPRFFPDAQADARAAGATDILAAARVCDSLDEALEGTTFACALSARSRDLAPVELEVRGAAGQICEEARAGEVAVVFGPENHGLGIADVSRCHLLVRIATNPGYSSLNLAAAVQVVAYELRHAALAGDIVQPVRAASKLATHADVEGLINHLEQTMLATGFFEAERPGRLIQRMRRMFARTRIEPEEVALLRGFLRSVTEGGRSRWPGNKAKDEASTARQDAATKGSGGPVPKDTG
jgi:tRNA/rRNA methyltransferase